MVEAFNKVNCRVKDSAAMEIMLLKGEITRKIEGDDPRFSAESEGVSGYEKARGLARDFKVDEASWFVVLDRIFACDGAGRSVYGVPISPAGCGASGEAVRPRPRGAGRRR